MGLWVFAEQQRIPLIGLIRFCTCAFGQTVSPKTQKLILKNFENVHSQLSHHNRLHTSSLRSSVHGIFSRIYDSHHVIVIDRTVEVTERRVFTAHLRFLLGIILLSCIQSVVNENVDINTLARIVKFFRKRYVFVGQYAVAINVPKEQCQSGFNPSESTFLKNDKSEKVKPYIKPDSKVVYKGTELIAAGRHKDAHSEYLLMNPPNKSPLTHLMNKKKDGCVIFYTLNSPCIDKCLNSDIIIKGLNELKAYQGIKAFVYTYIFKNDQNHKNLQKELKKIAQRVPLYRCNKEGCNSCGETVIDECIKAD
ncbi:uncharacterized protein LOC107705624 [Sinocyclocheilus rhinocerous]|uniref:uncharacterized protein LOC107705624 n=1 Tax=Sinocyclocheilus rhinocerous TaxID=307959 RepID=UPI0007B867C8|nr:PREDICTED: uncharacterized protein LOC107705624 [Sinocyclocheilus rhinocerous]